MKAGVTEMKGMYPRRGRIKSALLVCLAFVLPLFAGTKAVADDGYRLWLRYYPVPANVAKDYRARVTSVVVQGQSPTLDALRAELVYGCGGLLGSPVPPADKIERDGALVVGTPNSSPLIKQLGWQRWLAALGPEGFRIRSVNLGGRAATVIASSGETGALYGAFHFLRLIQTLQPVGNLDKSEAASSTARAQPLGQPRRQCGARLRGPLAVGMGRAARQS